MQLFDPTVGLACGGGSTQMVFQSSSSVSRGDGETYVSRYIAAKGYSAFYHPKASIYHHVPQKRMTLEYFCQRAYNEGIPGSYAKIRTAHGLDSDVQSSLGQTERPGADSLWARVSAKQPREILAALRNRVERLMRIQSQSIADKSSKQQAEYLKAIAAAYESGFAFHQKAIQESEMLLAWVLRPNYWDAQISDESI